MMLFRLMLLFVTLATSALTAWAHGDYGQVDPPVLLENISVNSQQGRDQKLKTVLQGKVTALQLMFARCQSICGLQGASFQRLQTQLADQAEQFQLLSLSLDPERDTPSTLQSWLRQFKAGPNWQALVATPAQTQALLQQLNASEALVSAAPEQGGAAQPTTPSKGHHGAQVYLINQRGELVWRSFNFPDIHYLAQLMKRLIQQP